MYNTCKLEASVRESSGKSAAKQLRKDGMIPCVLYGDKQKEITFSVSKRNLSHIIYDPSKPGVRSKIIEIDISGKSHKAVIREVKLHPVTDQIEHVDFLRVSKNGEVKAMVRVRCINKDKSLGVRRGGIINTLRRYIEVVCSEKNVPEYIDIDATKIVVGTTIHFGDLVLPEGVKLTEKNLSIPVVSMTGRGSSKSTTEGDEKSEESSATNEEKK